MRRRRPFHTSPHHPATVQRYTLTSYIPPRLHNYNSHTNPLALKPLPDLTDVVNGFGCLYVLEGSTLGSQFISRHVQKILGVTPEGGGRYFHGYGERTGEMWREFGAALTAFAVERETQDRIVENAIATFRRLRGWFQRGHVS